MKTLIPIPDAESYGIVILLLLGLASFQLSSFFHQRWLSKLGLISSHIIVKTIIAVIGLVLIPLPFSFAWRHLLSIPVGLILGSFCVFIEKKWMRQSNHRIQMGKRLIEAPTIKPKSLFGGTSEKKTFAQIKPSTSFEFQMSWSGLMFLGVLEELIFRGFLLDIFKHFVESHLLKILFIVIGILVFGASHLLNGYAQMKSKAFFAALATFSALLCDSLVAPIVAHLYLNHVAYKLSKQARKHEIRSFVPT